MPTQESPRVAPASTRSALHLGFATAIVCAVVGLCQLVVHHFSLDGAELDGFVFVAGLYWVFSVVGYFTTPIARKPQTPKAGARERQVSRAKCPT